MKGIVIKKDNIKVSLNGVKKGEVMLVVIMEVLFGNVFNNGFVNNWYRLLVK